MQLLQDGIIAALSAVGLTTLVWLLVGAFLHPHRSCGEKLVLIPARDEAQTLEQDVRAAVRARREEGGAYPIVIVDCGISDTACAAAELLCADYERVICCTREELPKKF